MDAITTELMTQFTAVGTALQALVVDIMPVVLPIIGGVFIVTKGISLFKKVAGKAS